jgi:hypothetical protein
VSKEIWAAKDLCTQCGRSGHFVKDCYAKTDISGNIIEYEDDSEDDEWMCEYCDKTFQTEYSAAVHEKSCTANRSKTKYLGGSRGSGGLCYRCGRSGHYSPDCYASKHVHGYYL